MQIFNLIFKSISIILIILLIIIPSAIISIIIILDSKGPVLHWSKRIGKNNNIFLMPKFRTMKTETNDVASHLLNNPEKYITRFGNFLRKTSIDEIPQIYSIIKNDMNFIGPRPALHNQNDLIEMRTKKNIHKIKPGITGYAQVNGRDILSIENKVDYDNQYYQNNNMIMNLKIILKTLILIFKRTNIKH